MTEHRTLEAIRYLGYGRNAVDEKIQELIAECFKELEQCARTKSVYRIFECIVKDEDQVRIGEIKIESKHLARNLRGCKEALIFAVTLGTEVDLHLRRLGISNVAKAVVFQACAAAYLEEYIDECQKEMENNLLAKQKYLRPRFSPGYGDTTITLQEEILRVLDAAKKIGLTRTESDMLVPSKSVTAFIGISEGKTDCRHRSGCEACEKTDCVYRRC